MKIDGRSMSKAEIRNYWETYINTEKTKKIKQEIGNNLKWDFCKIFDRRLRRLKQ